MFIVTKVKKRKRNNILFHLLQDHIWKVLVVSLWLSLCPPGKLGAHARLCKAGSLLRLHALSLFSKDAWLEQEKYAQRGLFSFSSFAPDYWFFLSIHFWLLPPFSLTTFSSLWNGDPVALMHTHPGHDWTVGRCLPTLFHLKPSVWRFFPTLNLESLIKVIKQLNFVLCLW